MSRLKPVLTVKRVEGGYKVKKLALGKCEFIVTANTVNDAQSLHPVDKGVVTSAINHLQKNPDIQGYVYVVDLDKKASHFVSLELVDESCLY